jgi:predicted RNA-binding Zn-ribbon protein involved in translation (DUF1610 family)
MSPENTLKKRNKHNQGLSRNLARLAEDLVRIKKQAANLGVFTNDRELLECPKCGLMEDVTHNGFLITHKRIRRNAKDSGLRFKEVDGTTFRCPSCGTLVNGVIL